MDRVYFSHAFVLEMMRKQAATLGITFRRQHNDYSPYQRFCGAEQPA